MMIEKSLLFLPFYIAETAGEYCFSGLDEYCFDDSLLNIFIAVVVLLTILSWCCYCDRRRRQRLPRTITVNQDQYLVLPRTPAAPDAGHSQPALARFQPVPAPPYMPRAAEYQPVHAGEAAVQKPKAQATSVPPPYRP